MIDYFKGIYSLNLLGRIHGSALYRGSVVGLFSVAVYLAIVLYWNENYSRPQDSQGRSNDLDHPYGVGVLVTSVTFLIIFRANHAYGRYWEACVSFGSIIGRVTLYVPLPTPALIFVSRRSTPS